MCYKKISRALLVTALALGVSGKVSAALTDATVLDNQYIEDVFGGAFITPGLEALPAHSDEESQKIPKLEVTGTTDGATESQEAIFAAYRGYWKDVASAWDYATGARFGGANLETKVSAIRDRSNGSAGGTSGVEYYTLSMLVRSAAMRAVMYNGMSWLDQHISYIKGFHRFIDAAVASRHIHAFLDEYFKETGAKSGLIDAANALIKKANFDVPGYGWRAPQYTYAQFVELGLRLKRKLDNAATVKVGVTAVDGGVSTRGTNRDAFFSDWLDATIELLQSRNPRIVKPAYLIEVLRNFTAAGTDDIATSAIAATTTVAGVTRYLAAEKIAKIMELIATNPEYMAMLGKTATELGGSEATEKGHAIAGVMRLAANQETSLIVGGNHIFGARADNTRLHLTLIALALGANLAQNDYGFDAATDPYFNVRGTTAAVGSTLYDSTNVYTLGMESSYKIGSVWANVPGGISVLNAPVSTIAQNLDTIF